MYPISQDTPPHVQRMIQEYVDLTDKVHKLSTFIVDKGPIYEKLDKMDKDLLDQQLDHMQNYSKVLTHRIERALGGK